MSSFVILQSVLPSSGRKRDTSTSTRLYSLIAHSTHWRTWSWVQTSGSEGQGIKRRILHGKHGFIWEYGVMILSVYHKYLFIYQIFEMALRFKHQQFSNLDFVKLYLFWSRSKTCHLNLSSSTTQTLFSSVFVFSAVLSDSAPCLLHNSDVSFSDESNLWVNSFTLRADLNLFFLIWLFIWC